MELFLEGLWPYPHPPIGLAKASKCPRQGTIKICFKQLKVIWILKEHFLELACCLIPFSHMQVALGLQLKLLSFQGAQITQISTQALQGQTRSTLWIAIAIVQVVQRKSFSWWKYHQWHKSLCAINLYLQYNYRAAYKFASLCEFLCLHGYGKILCFSSVQGLCLHRNQHLRMEDVHVNQ